MSKLFLIRRNMESFLGPMSLSEMKDAYKRMNFGLQDEVSGHCGPWVSFDNLEKVKKYYPEVARIVNEDMLAGWGVSDHSAVRLVNEDTAQLAIKNRKGMGLAVTFLVIAVVAFAAAVYMAGNKRFSGKLKGGGPEVTKARDLLDRNDVQGFREYMKKHLTAIVERTGKKRSDYQTWIPYLRRYAFATDGHIKGFAPKLLRGNGANSAPLDCSKEVWRRRWRANAKSWTRLFAERRFIRAHWARLLAWDPHWIRRRPMSGWEKPANYYVACLTMAQKALDEVSRSSPSSGGGRQKGWERYGIRRVRLRLDWLVRAAKDPQASPPRGLVEANDALAKWTCFESAGDLAGLDQCRSGRRELRPKWKNYNEQRYGWNLVRLGIEKGGVLSGSLIDEINKRKTELNRVDHFTRFDYRPEREFLEALAKQDGRVAKAIQSLQGFANVKWNY